MFSLASRGGHLREPGVDAAVPDQEWRQAGKRRVDQECDPPLGERAHLGDRDRKRIGRQRDGLGMEVATGEDLFAVGEDERIVGDRVRLSLQRVRSVAQLIEARPHHLWLATKRVGVLYARIVLHVGTADLALLEKRPVGGGDVALPDVPAQRVNARVEGRVAPRRRIDRECTRHQSGGEHVLARKEPHQCQRVRYLRSVEQRQPFLGRELERGDAGCGERLGGGKHPRLHADLAEAEEGEREMRERCEIARGADRTLRGHRREDACVVHYDQALDELDPHSRMPAREAGDLQCDREPYGRVVEQRAGACRMRKHDVALQGGELGIGNACLREAAEAGVDAVGRCATREYATDAAAEAAICGKHEGARPIDSKSRAMRRSAGRVRGRAPISMVTAEPPSLLDRS